MGWLSCPYYALGAENTAVNPWVIEQSVSYIEMVKQWKSKDIGKTILARDNI